MRGMWLAVSTASSQQEGSGFESRQVCVDGEAA